MFTDQVFLFLNVLVIDRHINTGFNRLYILTYAYICINLLYDLIILQQKVCKRYEVRETHRKYKPFLLSLLHVL